MALLAGEASGAAAPGVLAVGAPALLACAAFLLARPWVAAAHGEPGPPAGRWLRRRIAAVVLPFVVVAVAGVVVVALLPAAAAPIVAGGASAFGGQAPAWLPVALAQLVVLAPLVALAVLALPRDRRGRPVLGLALLAALTALAALSRLAGPTPALAYSGPGLLAWWAPGIAVAVLARSGGGARSGGRRPGTAVLGLGAAALVLLGLGAVGALSGGGADAPPGPETVRHAGLAVAAGLVLVAAATRRPGHAAPAPGDAPTLLLLAAPVVLGALVGLDAFGALGAAPRGVALTAATLAIGAPLAILARRLPASLAGRSPHGRRSAGGPPDALAPGEAAPGGVGTSSARAGSPDVDRARRLLAGLAGALLPPILALVVGYGALREGAFAAADAGLLLIVVALLATLPLLAGGRLRGGRAVGRLVAALVLYALLCLASAAWAPSPTGAREAAILPLLAAAAVLLGALGLRGRAGSAAAACAVALGVAAAAGIVGSALPALGIGGASQLAGGRLAEPYGYWNVAGLAAGLAVVLAAGALRPGVGPVLRAVLAAVAVPAGAALVLSLSRGALLSTALGLLVLLAVDPRRRRLGGVTAVAGCAAAGAAVGLVAGPGPGGAPAGALTLVTVAVAAVAVGVATGLVGVLARRRRAGRVDHPDATVPGRRRRRALVVVCGLLAITPVAAVLAGAGDAQPEFGTGAARLTSLGTDRLPYWRVAVETAVDEPLRGVGAGAFGEAWLARRTQPVLVQNAHSQPLESAAELGIPGLLLVLVVIGATAAVLRTSARRDPAAAAVPIAATLAYAAHASVDWDWQFPVPTLVVALLVGAAAAVPRRSPVGGRTPAPASAQA